MSAEAVIHDGGRPTVMAVNRTSLVLYSNSPSDTFRIGRILGEGLEKGDCVALTGELGTGKTCLTQGIARGLGVPNTYAITSPTFTLINEYPGRNASLYHLDVYRLTGPADLMEMGFEEYLLGSGVVVIEWAEKIKNLVPEEALCVSISYVDEEERRIEISGLPERMASWKLGLKRGGC